MINKLYLDKNIGNEIRTNFLKHDHILLNNFFDKKHIQIISKKVLGLKLKKTYFPDKFIYDYAEPDKKLVDFLFDFSFLDLLQKISGKEVKRLDLSLKRFSHRNYVIMNDSINPKKGLVFLFFLCPKDWKKEFGGEINFNLEDNNFTIVPQDNSFLLIDLKKETRTFVNYVNHLSKNKEFFVVECKLN